ncbi:hypothetical protein P3W45_001213 [Vairimorpha bombi]|jgi:ribosomal protein L10
MKTKIEKKSKDQKFLNLDKIPNYISKYPYMCLVENTDINSTLLRKMRSELEDSDIIFVKKNFLIKKYGLSDIKDIKNNFFLVFTDSKGIGNLKSYKYEAYLESGDVSNKKIVVEKGQIKNKALGSLLPTITEKNIIFLEDDYLVCNVGDVVDEKVCCILKCLRYKLKEEPIRIIKIYETKDINKLS